MFAYKEILTLDDPRTLTLSRALEDALRRGIPMYFEAEATLLLLGIYEDTGAFTFGGTTARDLRAAAWLSRACSLSFCRPVKSE